MLYWIPKHSALLVGSQGDCIELFLMTEQSTEKQSEGIF